MKNETVMDGMDYIAHTANLKNLAEEAQKDCDCFIIDCAFVCEQPDINKYNQDLKKRMDDAKKIILKINGLGKKNDFDIEEPNYWMRNLTNSSNCLLRRIKRYQSR